MRRLPIQPRPDWQRIVESQGFHFHTPDGEAYWDESACYMFTSREVDEIEAATYELNAICLRAVQHVIDHNLFHLFQIPPAFVPWYQRAATSSCSASVLASSSRSPVTMLTTPPGTSEVSSTW